MAAEMSAKIVASHEIGAPDGAGTNTIHYIILNNAILKSNSSVFPRSEGYISQYTP